MDATLTTLNGIFDKYGLVGIAVIVMFATLLIVIRQQNANQKAFNEHSARYDQFNDSLIKLLSTSQQLMPGLTLSMQALTQRMDSRDKIDGEYLMTLKSLNPQNIMPEIQRLNTTTKAMIEDSTIRIIEKVDRLSAQAVNDVLEPLNGVDQLVRGLAVEVAALKDAKSYSDVVMLLGDIKSTQKQIAEKIDGVPSSIQSVILTNVQTKITTTALDTPVPGQSVVEKRPATGPLKDRLTIASSITDSSAKPSEPSSEPKEDKLP